MMGTNFYSGGAYLRRWEIVDGHARCPHDAFAVADLTQAEIDAQVAANDAVHAAIAAVEAYEAALRLTAGEEPPATIDGYDMDGNLIALPNPAYEAWTEAQAIIAHVTPETLELHLVRNPPPEPEEALLGEPIDPLLEE